MKLNTMMNLWQALAVPPYLPLLLLLLAGLVIWLCIVIRRQREYASINRQLRMTLQEFETEREKTARYRTDIEVEPTEVMVKSLDEELIHHAIERIEAKIKDTNYSVTNLSRDVGMTRGHLYKKLMAIVGMPPVEFIRVIRLKRGKNLLDQGKTNISEVADMVGLSPKSFAHYFKEMYGDTPTHYLKKLYDDEKTGNMVRLHGTDGIGAGTEIPHEVDGERTAD